VGPSSVFFSHKAIYSSKARGVRCCRSLLWVPPRDGSSAACGSQRSASGGRGVCASSVRS
jgi:hypothetical protein